MAMRCRWPPLNSCGYLRMKRGESPTRSSSSDTFRGMSRAGDVRVRGDGFGERVVDRHARVERRVRVLENHLEIRARAAQFVALEVGEVASREHDASGGGRDELEDRAPERGFAAAGFADQARAPRPWRSERSMPSTALTVPTCFLTRKPFSMGKCVLRSAISRKEAVAVGMAQCE